MAVKQEDSNFWRNILVAMPFAAGAAVAGKRIFTSKADFGVFGNVKAATSNAPESFIQQFASQYRSPVFHESLKQGQMEALEMLRRSGVKSETIADMWSRARRVGDPRGFVSGALGLGDDPITSLTAALSEHGHKPAMQRSMENFLERMQPWISGRVGVMGQAPIFKPQWQEVAALDDPMLAELAGGIKERIGGGMAIRETARPGAVGGMWEFTFTGGALGKERLRLMVPRTLTAKEAAQLGIAGNLAAGVIASGTTQQTLRTAGQFIEMEGATIKSTLNYPQWMMRRALDDLLPSILNEKTISRSLINRQVNQFNQFVIGHTKNMPGAAAGFVSPAMRYQIETGAAERFIFGPNFAEPTEQGVVDFMRANPELYPATSPRAFGKGRRDISFAGRRVATYKASLIDQSKMWLGGELFEWQRRPGQPFRGFYPTARAEELMSQNLFHQSSEWMVSQNFREALGANFAPRIRTAFVSEQYASQLEAMRAGVAPGAGIVSGGVSPLLESAHIRSIDLEPSMINMKLLEGAEEIAPGRFKFGTPLEVIDPGLDPRLAGEGMYPPVSEGQLLGYTSKGKPFYAERGRRILGAEAVGREGQQAFKLYVEETLKRQEFTKMFGVKAVFGRVGEERIGEVLGGLGIQDPFLAAQQAVVFGEHLRKNRSAHNMQMAVATWDFLSSKIARNISIGGMEAHLLAANPQYWMEQTARQAAGQGPDFFAQEILKTVRSGGLGPAEIGRVFGAYTDILKAPILGRAGAKDIAMFSRQLRRRGLSFRRREVEEIMQGVATGGEMLFHGGPVGLTGAGRAAALEPRFYEMLHGAQFGTFGRQVSEELWGRRLRAAPWLAREQQMLGGVYQHLVGGKTEISFAGMPRVGIAQVEDEMLRRESAEFLGRTGGVVELGGMGGLKELVLPSAEDVRSLRPHAAGGQVYESTLMKQYMDFIRVAKSRAAGGITEEAFAEQAGLFKSNIAEAMAATVTGRGKGIAAGKIPGSMRLRAVTAARAGMETGGPFTVGLSERAFKRMMGQMQRTGSMDETTATNMLERFMAGEEIGGMIARDPAIGPFSIQATGFRRADIQSHDIVMPSRTVSAHRILPGGGVEALGDIDIGPAAGLAQDFDEDIVDAVVLSPKLGKSALAARGGEEYTEYAIAQKLLKQAVRGPAGATLTAEEKRIAAMMQLAMPQRWTGLLSDALSQARASVIASNLDNTARRNALIALEAMEQTPISGKWLDPAKVLNAERLRATFQTIIQGARGQGMAGGAEALRAGMGELFGAARPGSILAEMAGEGANVVVGGETRRISLNLAQAAEDIAQAIAQSKHTRGTDMSEARFRQLLFSPRGGRRFADKEADAFFKHAASVFKPLITPLETPAGATASKVAQAVRNEMGAVGGRLLKIGGKPLAIGFGASLALGAVLSRPISNLEPESRRPLSDGMLRARGPTMPTAESVHPDHEISGQPSTGGSAFGPGRQMVRPGTRANRISIRARSNVAADYEQLSEQIKARLPGKSSVNVRTFDDRSRLTPQRIDNIINS